MPSNVNWLGGKNFGGSAGPKNSNSPDTCGFQPDVHSSVPPQYIIRIEDKIEDESGDQTKTKYWVVKAVLQTIPAMILSSAWEPYFGAVGASNFMNTVVQAVFKKSLVTRYSTRRIWSGTTPISLPLSLKFNAVYDAYREVVLPCIRLTQMTLPSENKETKGIPFLRPPGPSPFKWEDIPVLKEFSKSEWGKYFGRGGDTISVNIGMLLTFNSVIVKDINIQYNSLLTKDGYPTGANVNLTIESYEILTKEKIAEAYGKTYGNE